MVKPIILVFGAIPVIFALLIMVPMVTMPEIPTSAINPNDTIHIEYTKYELEIVSFGVTDKTVAKSTEILIIKNDRTAQYNKITEDGNESQIVS